MDKHKIKNSVLEYSNVSIPGYSIQYGDTTYENTLEERIQEVTVDVKEAKKAQKINSKGKYSLKNSVNTAVENKSIKKTNFAQEYKNIQCFSSLNTGKNINTNLHNKFNTNFPSKSTFKGGGSVQHRIESIKANKLSHITPLENNTLELNKVSNNVSKNLNCQDAPIKNYVPNQNHINLSKHNDNKIKSTVTKNIHNEVKHDHNKNINITSSKFK